MSRSLVVLERLWDGGEKLFWLAGHQRFVCHAALIWGGRVTVVRMKRSALVWIARERIRTLFGKRSAEERRTTRILMLGFGIKRIFWPAGKRRIGNAIDQGLIIELGWSWMPFS